MPRDAGRLLCIAAVLAAGLLGIWTAWVCHWAEQRELSGSEFMVWAGLAAMLLTYSFIEFVRYLGVLHGLGWRLRAIAIKYRLYGDRQGLQLLASIVVALIVGFLFLIGLLWMARDIERYRLAIAFASLLIGFRAIRFISLHEVDAWNAAMPWALLVVELTAAVGISAVAIIRLYELGELGQL